jgi:hypothetical protein
MSGTYIIQPQNRVAGSAGHLADHDNLGAVLSAVPDIQYSVLNTQYAGGADPTGYADSTAAINATLTATPAGGVCFVPAGTYKITGTIVIPNDVTLKGTDASDPTAGSILSVANSSNLSSVISDGAFSSNSSSVSNGPRIEGMILKCNGANQASGLGVGIAFCSYRGEIFNCRVNDSRGDGIRIANQTANAGVVSGSVVECKIRDCTIAGCGTAGTSGNREGIALRDSGAGAVTDFWVEDCVIWEGALTQTKGMGIYANSPVGGIVRGNHLYGIGTHGIYMQGTGATRVVDNYVEYFGQLTSSGACYGIYVMDSGGAPGCYIAGNTINVDDAISGNTFVGLYLTNVGSNQQAFFGLGVNTFYTSSVSAATAVSIQNQGSATNFTVAGSAQMCYGFTQPYVLNNAYGTYVGDMFKGLQDPAYASTMAVDLTKGTTVMITLTGNVAMDIPTQMVTGMSFTFIFYQPTTGGTYNYTVTWTNNNTAIAKWVNATFVATTGASAMSAVTFVTDGYDIVQVV